MSKMMILRGVSGCGKSTKANELYCLQRNLDAKICSADQYFVRPDGAYSFNPKELGLAHAWCQHQARQAVMDRIPLVIIDNTNTQHWEMEPYRQIARDYNYEVEVIVVGQRDEESLKLYASRNKHGVPYETIVKMAARWEE